MRHTVFGSLDVTSVLVDVVLVMNVTTVGSGVGEENLVGCAVCALNIGATVIENEQW